MKEPRSGSKNGELEAAFRRLKATLDIDSALVARWSEVLGVPVSRDFLAEIIMAGLPSEAEDFAAFWKSTGLSLDIIREAAGIPSQDALERFEPSTSEFTPEDHSSDELGHARLAAAIALGAAAKARARGECSEYAEGLLRAAQAYLNASMWRFARELAEAAIEAGTLTGALRARAVFTIADALLRANRYEMARSALNAIEEDVLQENTALHVDVLQARSRCLHAEGEHGRALDAIVRSLHLTTEDSIGVRLQGLALLARILMEAGEIQAAASNIDLAVDLSKHAQSKEFRAELRALQGRILLRLGRPEDAREALLSALMSAGESTCFEAQLGMFEWETRRGDRRTAMRWQERITEHIARHSLPPHRRREWNDVRRESNEATGENRRRNRENES